MGEWELPAEIAGVVLAFLVLPLVWLFVRRRWLSSRGGLFDCSLARGSMGQRWVLGLARYQGNTLQWYPAFGVGLRPKLSIERSNTSFESQRIAEHSEALQLFSDDVVVRLRSRSAAAQGGGEVVHQLAMAPASLTGLLSWLEAAPPGGQGYAGGE